MVTPSPDTVLHPLHGEQRALHEWLTTFHLLSVVIDPYTNESGWVLKTARRVLAQFAGSSVRTNYVVTAGPDDARAFLGPLADEAIVFCDADRTFVKQLGLQKLPAFVFLRIDGNVVASAEGWNPLEWRTVADEVARTVAWSKPLIPAPGDPGAFAGTPALV
ncbi:MAG: TlpA family protein disulfide reductase [Actinomycetota bacterium]